MNEKLEFFLHDVFMEIMDNLDSLQDYEDTLDALEEGCLMNLSSDGETEEERTERLRLAEERRKQLEKELKEAEKEKEREAIERRIRLRDAIREFLLLNDISFMPGISGSMETMMFAPLKAVSAAIRKLHPGKADRDIEFEKNDRMLVKAELSRVRMRFEAIEGDGLKKSAREKRKTPDKEKQEVLKPPVRVKTL